MCRPDIKHSRCLAMQSPHFSLPDPGRPHLSVAQVSLVEGDPGQLVALSDVKHTDGVASIQQLLHQVSAQEARPPDHCTPLITLQEDVNDACQAK